MKFLVNIKNYWNSYKHNKYLKKRGWTELDYQKHHDPDCNYRSTCIKDYYRGYPYFHVFTSTRTMPWTEFGNWMDCYKGMNDWCESNCLNKFRSDIHRVIKEPSNSNEWEMNEMSGGDALFYAFKDSRDYTIFLLRWT